MLESILVFIYRDATVHHRTISCLRLPSIQNEDDNRFADFDFSLYGMDLGTLCQIWSLKNVWNSDFFRKIVFLTFHQKIHFHCSYQKSLQFVYVPTHIRFPPVSSFILIWKRGQTQLFFAISVVNWIFYGMFVCWISSWIRAHSEGMKTIIS